MSIAVFAEPRTHTHTQPPLTCIDRLQEPCLHLNRLYNSIARPDGCTGS